VNIIAVRRRSALKSVLPEAMRKEKAGWRETIVRPRAAV
jgi:hypothetical protein